MMIKPLITAINRYKEIPNSTLRLITGLFILNLVNGSFILILNIYLRKAGFDDAQIGSFTSYRFLGVLLLAFPFGIYIKGKSLKPYFITASILIPSAAFLMIESVKWGNPILIKASFLLWGLGLMMYQVCALPYLMRTTPESVLPDAIALNFSVWSLAIIVTGIFISILTKIGEFSLFGLSFKWDEYHIILLFIIISSVAFFLINSMEESRPRSDSSEFKNNFSTLIADYDWFLIIKAIVPTLLIAVGAGLTIPFINLFFYSVFGMDSAQFGLLGSFASAAGFFALLMAPSLKRKYGYKISIITTQVIGITLLIILIFTELLSAINGIIFVAIAAYIIRQPMMHISSPITSELMMKYVGDKNQELISAVNSSIWSASWFISAKIFQMLRDRDFEYYKIFFLTAVLYGMGVMLYYFIIREFEERRPEQQTEEVFEPIIIDD